MGHCLEDCNFLYNTVIDGIPKPPLDGGGKRRADLARPDYSFRNLVAICCSSILIQVMGKLWINNYQVNCGQLPSLKIHSFCCLVMEELSVRFNNCL